MDIVVRVESEKHIYIKFNTSPTDIGASDVWQEGMEYLGVVVSFVKTVPDEGYCWVKLAGEKDELGEFHLLEEPDKDECPLLFRFDGDVLTIAEKETGMSEIFEEETDDETYRYGKIAEVKMLQFDLGNGERKIVWCRPYVLSIHSYRGVNTVRVVKESSLQKPNSREILKNGSTLHYGDKLTVEATCLCGYELCPYKTEYTVTNHLALFISAYPQKYKLTISKSKGVNSVVVSRKDSPNECAKKGALQNGADIFFGDELVVTSTPSKGYKLRKFTSLYSVLSDVVVYVSAEVEQENEPQE